MINKLELDIKNGLNHDITSRKEKIRVSPKLFSEYSSKYYNLQNKGFNNFKN